MKLHHIVLVIFMASMLIQGCGDNENNNSDERPKAVVSMTSKLDVGSLRKRIFTVIQEELPNAESHLSGSKLVSQLRFVLLNDEVLKIAEVAVKQSSKDSLYLLASMGWGDPNRGIAASISAIGIPADESTAYLERALDGGFQGIVDHYTAQTKASAIANHVKFDGIVHLVMALKKDGQISAAIGLSDFSGNIWRPRQLPKSSIPKIAGSLAGLPPARCDVTNQLIQPGEGYLLTAKQVAASERYWASLDEGTKILMKQIIATDTSPWLVHEQVIDWFEVDKNQARQAAIEYWKEKL